MFALGILIGIYSYSLFILGILYLLYPIPVVLVTIAWIGGVVYWFKKDKTFTSKNLKKLFTSFPNLSTFSKICVVLVMVLWGINLIGALAPEISFDALWYHLTIPKIFINNHSFFYIQGGLYYYSLMPKLVDMLYVPSVMVHTAPFAKLIHLTFGVLTLIALYFLSRRFVSQSVSFFILLLFSANLVVAWEATTAYIDLGRTFFEVMAVYGLVLYLQEKKRLWLTESAVMIGFAIATKVVAITSLPFFLIFIFLLYRKNIQKAITVCIKYGVIALAIPLPYWIFSLLSSGNPFYPIFTQYIQFDIPTNILSITAFIQHFWQLFVHAADPINPIYILVFPWIFIVFKKFSFYEKIFVLYVGINLVITYFLVSSGETRYLLPYLPILSLLTGITIIKIPNKLVKKICFGLGIGIAVTTIGYRAIASSTYIPVVFGMESRDQYLTKTLDYSFGDFYDTDGYFAQTLTKDDTVLVYGIHNLYYANFPFIHESYAKSGDEFNYILAPTDMILPSRFYAWKITYSNPVTNVTLYSQEGNTWVY